jgi:hypothetical protein
MLASFRAAVRDKFMCIYQNVSSPHVGREVETQGAQAR